MTRRYLFLCPDRRSASGGIAVIYDAVAALRRAGHEAFVLHGVPGAGYPDHPETPPQLFNPAHRRADLRTVGRRAWPRLAWQLMRDLARGGPLPRYSPRPGDVIVAPEIMIDMAVQAYPELPLVVFVQNPFAFQRTIEVALSRGRDIREHACFFLSVSELCNQQLDLLQIPDYALIPASMKPADFPFAEGKERLITYMPRKRPAEARLIDAALRARGRIGDYRVEALDGLPRAQIAERLGRSRFFLSLQQRESIGFPAAEAMAAGCVVVGYTGLGGREYFDTTTGIPVTEDDTYGLVTALEAAIAEHEADPARLEALRRHASETIHARYTPEAFEAGLRAAWAEIEKRL